MTPPGTLQWLEMARAGIEPATPRFEVRLVVIATFDGECGPADIERRVDVVQYPAEPL